MSYPSLHALIVDDFDSFRSTLNKMLADLGFGRVDSASTGEEALRYCRTRAYDLILCDHNLGKGKSGQQVLEDIRVNKNLCSDSLFILISAENSKSIIMAAYDYEPDAYLTKPINSKTLEQRLTRLLAQRKALEAITQAKHNGDDALAIKLCQQEINSGGRHANQCQKMLGQLLLAKRRYSEAETLYKQVLAVRELEWAQLGMAQLTWQQGNAAAAEQWLREVLERNPLCMKAYDLRADIYRAKGDSDALQALLQQATDISPLSILRQQALGSVAQQNNDLVVAATALRRAVKLGENSTFDSPQVHSQFAQATVDLYASDKELAKPLLREALKAALDIEEKFPKTALLQAQAKFLESQLLHCSGDIKRAEEVFALGQMALRDIGAEDGLAAEMELVRSLRTLGREREAQQQLAQLATKYSGQQEALERLDVLQEEPQSERNKQLVASINKTGIAAYNSKQYQLAADAFKNALQRLPNHIGLRLNFVQAAIDVLRQGFNPTLSKRVGAVLAKTANSLSTTHAQYRRYRQLFDSYQQLLKQQGLS